MRLLLVSLFILSACAHLNPDPFPGHAENNFKRVEFDIIKSAVIKKEIGIANVLLTSDKDLEDTSIKVYGIYKGNIYFRSPECGIDLSERYSGVYEIVMKTFINEPKKCSIDVVIETDKIDDKEHKIVELGTIKLFYIDQQGVKPAYISYNQTNSFSQTQEYKYLGQASLQRSEGSLTQSDNISIETPSKKGTYRIVGCNTYIYEGQYDNSKIEVTLKDMYSYDSWGTPIHKEYLTVSDSCDFNIIVLPYDEAYSYQARILINIYAQQVVKLEPLAYNIKGSKLKISGADYVIVCIINDSFEFSNSCKIKYEQNKDFWIRGITRNGRKSVYSIKNGNIDWSE